MQDISTIKLPLFSKRQRLPLLPEQPAGMRYLLFWGACPQPKDALCYVGEMLQNKQVRFLAYVSNRGYVYRTDHALSETPTQPPALAIGMKDDGECGTIYRANQAGTLEEISAWRGAVQGLLREEGTTSWNAQHATHYREFMATLFLRYCVFLALPPAKASSPSTSPASTDAISMDMSMVRLHTPLELFGQFQTMLLPDAIDTLLYRIGAQAHPSGIELFARRVLTSLDLARLRKLAETTHMSLARIERMSGFYINFDRSSLGEEDIAYLLSVEAALNRLSLVLDCIGSSVAPISASPSEEACSYLDMSLFAAVSSHVKKLQALAHQQNPWSMPGTVACTPGGEWDIRTRVAELCEQLNLIVRLEYALRYDTDARCVRISYLPPTALCMPASLFQVREHSWNSLDAAQRGGMAVEYSSRMALVLAAACFAAGVVVESCVVSQASFAGVPAIDRVFSRAEFLAELLPVAAALDAAPLVQMQATTRLAAYVSGHVAPPENPPGKALPPRQDPRYLPHALRDMLLADKASELEVMESADDPYLPRVTELRRLAQTDREAAATGLIQIIEELEAKCVAAELMAEGHVISQYCDNYFCRLIYALDEHKSRQLRILRVPDALYTAQFELANMYAQAGLYEKALPEAQKLFDMALTSTSSHFALINVLAHLERYEELIQVAKHGLARCFERDAAAYYLYRTAFALWRLGDRTSALACYRIVLPSANMGETARLEMRALMAEMGVLEAPSIDEARTILRRAEIPLPPTEKLVHFMADAAVLLSDNGFFFLAARCTYEMWRTQGRDELNIVQKSFA